jgi:CRP-like cAMP-binding protein
MEKELLEFMGQFSEFTPEEAAAIGSKITAKTYKKGTVLLSEGEVSSECFFVLKGCIRQYYLIDGEEKTTAFFTEQEAAVSLASYAAQLPSSHFLCCTEDCLLIVGDFNEEQEMYREFPKLEALTRTMMEQDYGKTQETLAAFMTSTPEERYLNLQKTRPALLQRVPQHQLASYLGVTPESLSRIRKRIVAKKLLV